MDVREKLVELLSEYFNIGDSYAYNFTRVKSAFSCGTVGFCDFEEFDDETVTEIADYLIANGVTVQVKPQTNADRIRAMSDEELAVFLAEIQYDSNEPSTDEMFEWLKQPAEVRT